ncbi:glycosylhydrolase family 18-1 [Diaporthe eres]|nr:glycosylhydrolase family 18-1 [Diaporthe eres]
MPLPCKFVHIIATFAVVLLSTASAGFSPSSRTNLAVYWGQNSYGQSSSQQRLSAYCSNTDIDVITISFLTQIINPVVNFANAGDNCTVFTGTTLLSCPQIEEDIQLCQSSYQKTIMLSIGGATYTEGGFSSSDAAVSAANNIWAIFGPEQAGSTVKRPFGQAVVDGFDFDFESTTQNMPPFATQLRGLMTAATAAGGKPYYLSAAPQCPYPDLADDAMLNGGVSFDFIQIQFYNNYCGVSSFVVGASSQPSYNFDTWDNWARTGSANPNVKILVGIPANTGAGAGYTSGNVLQAALAYSQGFSSFGGVMMWDMSQLYKNPGFQQEVYDQHKYSFHEHRDHFDNNNLQPVVSSHVDSNSHNHSSRNRRACA